VTWHIAIQGGNLRALAAGATKELTEQAEHLKGEIRARVEYPFHLV